MTFKIDNFIVKTENKTLYLDEKIPKPQSIEKGRTTDFKWKHKTKEITVFSLLSLFENKEQKYYRVLNDIFVFIDLIEVLKAHNGNKLDTEKEYNFSNVFTAKISRKDGNFTLKIHFKNYSNSLFLDKFECSSLAAKFSKILQRCEAWQEQDR